jgi:hypothetical protein
MIGHETKGKYCEWIFSVDVIESPHELKHVFFRTENVLPIVAAHNDMVI